jgi:YtxH-like protein
MSYAGPASRGKRPRPNDSPLSGRLRNPDLTRLPANPRWPDRATRRDPTTAFAAGIAIGIAVGAGIAVLFAPRSGEDTRRAIADRGRRLVHRGGDIWDDLRDELQAAIDLRRHAWRHNGSADGGLDADHDEKA